MIQDPCNPSPCGANAECNNGICTCFPEYQGDPYRGCRPECVLNTDCPRERACVRNKCIDPCIGTCGQNALCTVYNHIPMCSCNPGFTGNAFILCTEVKGTFALFYDLFNKLILKLLFSNYCGKSMFSISMRRK